MLDCVSTQRAANERGEIMNGKRFALGCVAVRVVYQVLEFLIPQVVLGEIYKPADA